MTVLDPLTAVSVLRLAKFPSAVVPVMAAIGYAESGGDTTAVHRNSNGSTDYGWLQINSSNTAYADGADFFPPGNGWQSAYRNAVVGKKIYDAQGLKAWSTYNSGAYSQFLPKTSSAAGTTLTSQAQSELDRNLATLGIGAQAAGNALGLPVTPTINIDANGNVSTDWGAAVGNPLGSIFSGLAPALWIAGGCVLVLLGILMWSRNEINPVALAKAVAK